MARRQRISPNFNLGGEQAEADPLLEEAFYESSIFDAIASKRDPRRFLIGRTGSGKSAILQRLEETLDSHTIRIDPEALSLQYIMDLDVIRHLDALDVHLDPLFIALWKHVFVVEIIRHKYHVNSPEVKRTILATLMQRVRNDPGKRQALEYLEEFGESFWCETDERIKEITSKFEVATGFQGGIGAGHPLAAEAQIGASSAQRHSETIRTEEAKRYQRIVNDTQLPRLHKMIDVLDSEILESSNDFTCIVIDDLDRDWVDDRLSNTLIRCLFRAVMDLQKVRNLKIVVALRTNMFDFLDFGSRTGGQEEKIRSLSLTVQWTRKELLELADERARIAVRDSHGSEVSGIADLLPPKSKSKGDPFEFILGRTSMRPRDLIAYLNEALRVGSGKSRLTWTDIESAEIPYSQKRLLALRDEWKPTFPGIGDVFEQFRSAPLKMDQGELEVYLDQIALLSASGNFEGVVWMTALTQPLWDASERSTWIESYHSMVQFLFNIGFLGIRNRGDRVHYSYISPGHADSVRNLAGATTFAIHPAFRLALDI
jgi:hypothetical protein